MLNIVSAKDFSASAYVVTMRRVQEVALRHARKPVPLPSQQLHLMAAKKTSRKKGCPTMLS